MLDRRTALKLGAAAGATALLPKVSGCGDDGTRPPTGITTLVTLCMENRSYDHYLGARGLVEGLPGDGLTAGLVNRLADGTRIESHEVEVGCHGDPPHGWDASHVQWNGGANDGFAREAERSRDASVARAAMGYQTRASLPITWGLADEFTSCDRWFAGILGPTWPNRMYLHSASSGGLRSNELPSAGGLAWPSIYARLDAAGVDYRYYFHTLPFPPLFADFDVEKVDRIGRFFTDAAAGTLPPFVSLDPSFFINDDHPPTHPMLGQKLIAAVYAALAASPQWPHILFVVTYDEHGGFYDHVAPPTAPDARTSEGFGQLGFRVPTLVAGPYVKRGHVSSVVRDHASVLAHAERMFGLEPLTDRDAGAADLSECLDEARLAAFDPRPAPPMPPIEVSEQAIFAQCDADLEPPEVIALARSVPPHLDRRHEAKDALFAVGDALDRLGAGRIVRARR